MLHPMYIWTPQEGALPLRTRKGDQVMRRNGRWTGLDGAPVGDRVRPHIDLPLDRLHAFDAPKRRQPAQSPHVSACRAPAVAAAFSPPVPIYRPTARHAVSVSSGFGRADRSATHRRRPDAAASCGRLMRCPVQHLPQRHHSPRTVPSRATAPHPNDAMPHATITRARDHKGTRSIEGVCDEILEAG